MDRCVFINYRSVDSHSYAALLYTELIRRFGRDLVFLDAESIPAGEDYERELLERVRSARVVLAVIGPSWLTVTDRAGRRCIDDPADWIRRELAEAFAAGVQVIPVLTDDTSPPTPTALPPGIAKLSRCQARYLRSREPTADLNRIVADLTALDSKLAMAERWISGSESPPRDVANSAIGDVSGLLIQAGTIQGGVHFHSARKESGEPTPGHVEAPTPPIHPPAPC